jgi:hypothetical protein
MFKNSLIFLALVGALTLAMGTPASAWGSTYIIPHVVDGSYIYGTEIWIHNVQATSNQVLISFYDDNGYTWDIDLRSFEGYGGHQYMYNLNLQPNQSVFFFTGCIDPLKVGWARILSMQPINVSASFTFYNFNPDPPKAVWTAGVLPSPTATQFTFAADVSPVSDSTEDIKVDMGFAVVNPSTEDAHITATLIPASGGAAVSTKTIDLGPYGHFARFLSEFFNDVAWGDRWHGIVRLSSNVNIAVTALKHVYNDNTDVYSALAVQPDSTLRCNILYDREDNDSFADAQACDHWPVEIVGTVNSPADGTDLDYYSVYLNTGQTVYIFLLADITGSPLDGLFTIYDPGQAAVGGANTSITGLLDPVYSYTAATTGIHYIAVNSTGNTYGRESFYRMFVEVK